MHLNYARYAPRFFVALASIVSGGAIGLLCKDLVVGLLSVAIVGAITSLASQVRRPVR